MLKDVRCISMDCDCAFLNDYRAGLRDDICMFLFFEELCIFKECVKTNIGVIVMRIRGRGGGG